MPKIISKESTLNGEASIIKYNHRDTYYLRVKRDGKKYTNISLGTEDIKVARKHALTKYVEVSSTTAKTRNSKYAFARAVDEFLTEKSNQVSRGQLKELSFHSYEQRMHQRIVPYTRKIGVKNISDITKETFVGYGNFYLDIKVKGKWKNDTNGLSPSTINSDLTTLNEFLNWLVDNDVLSPKNHRRIPRVKDRKDYREESNPAFFPDEFRAFKDVLYQFDKDVDDDISKWKRRWFIHWVLFQYQGGFRLHETAQIRLADCRVEKRPDGKLKGIVNIAPTTKTGHRIVIMNGHTLNKVKYHLNKGIKLQNQELEIKGEEPIASVGRDDLLMMNPFTKNRTMYHSEHTRKWWKYVLDQSGLEKNYTMYSLRSTHITHALLQGLSTRQIADNCGTSQEQIERTYFRLNNLLNIDQLGFHKESSAKSKADDDLGYI